MKIALLSLALLTGLIGACKKGDTPKAVTPKLSISNLSQLEGTGGTTNFEFPVRLSAAAMQAITVTYSVEDGTAKAGEDFTGITNQVLTIPPGELQANIVVTVMADDIKEPDETFTVVINNVSNANISVSRVTGTIVNDDTKIPINNTGFDAPKSYPGYSLTWADEFDGTTLDASAWTFQNGDGCPNVCGWGNNELEYYKPDNLFLQDGKLIIEARNENVGGKSYSSSKILTEGKKAFKFGRIDIRAKLPVGRGIWPALWLLPENSVYGNWPKSGELDMMENLGHEPNKVYGTLHFGPGPGSTQIGKNFTLPTGTFADQFHVYSIEWKQDQIKWLIDNVEYGTAAKADFGANNYPFNEQFFLILNMAVGGNWPGSPDTTTVFPQWFMIDYVRVYQ